MPREISAGIIIYKREKDRDGEVETKYLLLYHGNGYWNFPKGKLEAGERGYDAALREVAEETGISKQTLRVDRNFKLTDKYIFQRQGQKIFKIVIFFLAQAIKPVINLSWEHDGFGWFLHRDAQRLLKHQNLRVILKKAHVYLQRKSSGSRPAHSSRPNA